MTAIILRRRKLGRTSVREIAAKMQSYAYVVRNWRSGDMPTELPEYAFRWGCTSSLNDLGLGIFASSPTIVNTAASIQWCSDK